MKRLYNPNELRNENDMNVTKFSSNLFNEYLIDFNAIYKSFLNQYFNSKNNISDIIDSIKKDFKKNYGKKIKIEYKDIKIQNFRVSEEYLKECKIPNLNVEKYQSNIEEISKMYLYIKELSKVFNRYNSSNANHFFKSLLKVINESNKFYTNDLQKSEIQYLIKLNQKLSEILKSISEKSAEINPDDFTEEKKKLRLNDIMSKSKGTLTNILTNINIMKQSIKQTISRMHEYKGKNRDDFNKIATQKAKENYKNLEENKNEIKKIIDKHIKTLEAYIQSIKDLTKNKKYENSNSLSLDEMKSSLTTYIRQENNYAYDLLYESDMNVIFKIAAAPVSLIGGLIAHFQDHSEEHEKFITEYEKSVNDSLSIYQEKIDKNIKTIENYYCEQVRDIFLINGKDIQKIKSKEKIFKDVEKELEDFLSDMVDK